MSKPTITVDLVIAEIMRAEQWHRDKADRLGRDPMFASAAAGHRAVVQAMRKLRETLGRAAA